MSGSSLSAWTSDLGEPNLTPFGSVAEQQQITGTYSDCWMPRTIG